VYVYVGGQTPDANPGQLENGRVGSIPAVGVGLGHRYSPNFALELEANVFENKYDAPLTLPPPPAGATVNDWVTVGGFGVVANVRLIAPLNWVEGYVGAGAGMYFTDFLSEGESGGEPIWLEARDTSFGYQLLAGADFPIGRWVWAGVLDSASLGIEYRDLKLTSDFGYVTGGKVDIGGRSLLVTLRFRFQRLNFWTSQAQ
jgi:hypothetical protein